MSNFLIVLIVIAAVLLTLLVLVQNSKGGGLASGFASGNQVLGAPKTADFLEKATWGLIAFIIVFAVAAVGFIKHDKVVATTTGTSLSEKAADKAEVAAESVATPDFQEEAEEVDE